MAARYEGRLETKPVRLISGTGFVVFPGQTRGTKVSLKFYRPLEDKRIVKMGV